MRARVRRAPGGPARRARAGGGARAPVSRAAEGRRLHDDGGRRHRARPARDAARPRRHLRARRQGRVPVVGADERDPGARRRRARDRHGRAHARRRAQSARARGGALSPGSSRAFAIGGAQAIAALAYGTATVPGRRQDLRAGQRVRRGGEAPRVRHRRHRHGRRRVGDRRGRRRDRESGLGRARPLLAGRARRDGAGDPADARRRRSSTASRRARAGCWPTMPRADDHPRRRWRGAARW